MSPIEKPTSTRLGIFGGSFDPVHAGHLALARACLEDRDLDEVWFVPAAVAPHKPQEPVATGPERATMLERAIGDDPKLRVSRIELDRGEVSYTVETLAAIRRERPEAELFLLVGSDTLADLPTWREPARICELARLLVVRRAGQAEPDFEVLAELTTVSRREEFRALALAFTPPDISSSLIRHRLSAGESIEGLTPPGVVEYIRQHGLYGAIATPPDGD